MASVACKISYPLSLPTWTHLIPLTPPWPPHPGAGAARAALLLSSMVARTGERGAAHGHAEALRAGNGPTGSAVAMAEDSGVRTLAFFAFFFYNGFLRFGQQ